MERCKHRVRGYPEKPFLHFRSATISRVIGYVVILGFSSSQGIQSRQREVVYTLFIWWHLNWELFLSLSWALISLNGGNNQQSLKDGDNRLYLSGPHNLVDGLLRIIVELVVCCVIFHSP